MPKISKAVAMAGTCAQGNLKAVRKVANNTFQYRRDSDGATVFRLHRTDIIVKHVDGRVILNSGGWQTVTTKDRFNSLSGYKVYSDKGQWRVYDYAVAGGLNKSVPYYDGIELPAAFNAPVEDQEEIERANRKLARKINKFVKGLDLLAELPKLDGGDCWLCSMFQREPERGEHGGGFAHAESPSDQAGKDYEHLRSHIAEGYLHGTLLVNAMRWAGYQDWQIAAHYSMDLRDRFKSALRRYLRRKLGLPA